MTFEEWIIKNWGKVLTEQAIKELRTAVKEEVEYEARLRGKSLPNKGSISGGDPQRQEGAGADES